MRPSFLMTITDVELNPSDENSARFCGAVQYGAANPGLEVSLHALTGESITAHVEDVLNVHPPAKTCCLIIRNVISPDRFRYGFVSSPPNSLLLSSRFLAKTRFLTPDEGGRSRSLHLSISGFPPYEVIFSIYDLTFLIRPTLPGNHNDDVAIEPGSTVELTIDLGQRYIPVNVGDMFQLQEGRKVVAQGAVYKLL